MMAELQVLWTPLAATPLVWIVVTLSTYLGAQRLQRRLCNSPLCNPVLIAIAATGAVAVASRTPYGTYLSGAQFINFLLGPATVALGVPLARNFHHIRSNMRSIAFALAAGSIVAIGSGVGLVWLLHGSRAVALSMAPKSATTPIAMTVSLEIGGIPALTAALAIIGGIVVAVLGRRLLNRMRIEDWRVHGLAAGVAGSGVAAASGRILDGPAAAFAAVGIALNGVLTALIVPALLLL